MSYELIQVRTEAEKVGIITLNRPKQLNALNSELMVEMGTALKLFDADLEYANQFESDDQVKPKLPLSKLLPPTGPNELYKTNEHNELRIPEIIHKPTNFLFFVKKRNFSILNNLYSGFVGKLLKITILPGKL